MIRQNLNFQNLGLLYLGMPFVIFQLFWIELWFSIPVLVAIYLALRYAVKTPNFAMSDVVASRRSGLAIAVLFSVTWAFFAGYFGVVFGRTPDWNQLRADYLSTFSSFGWPIKIPGLSDQPDFWLLSVPGLYLPPAGASKLLNADLNVTLYLMAAWMILGLIIVFQYILRRFSRPAEQLLAAILFVFFSGFDAVGAILTQASPLEYLLRGGHIEPWMGTVQLSSMTTLIFWVPHHTLSSWIGVALMDRARGTSGFTGVATSVIFLSVTWSTFSPIGLTAVAVLMFVCDRNVRYSDLLRCLPLVVFATVGLLPILDYFSKQTWVPRGIWWYFSRRALLNFGIENESVVAIVGKYLLFLALEILVWVTIGLWLRAPKAEIVLLLLTLVAISQVVSYGPSDFTMRASIAPFFLLFVQLVDKLVSALIRNSPRKSRLAILFLCAVMSWTGISEMMERSRRDPSTLQAPCIISGCESELYPPREGKYASTDKPLFFRD